MGNTDDNNTKHVILNFVEDPVVSLTQAISLEAGQLFSAVGAGIVRKRPNSRDDAGAIPGRDQGEFFCGRSLDLEVIACHAASSP